MLIMRKSAELICTGNELLKGSVNTHLSYIAGKLSGLGLTLSKESIIKDDMCDMTGSFKEAFKRSQVIITTGGLGPTFDDITREAWSKTLKRKLVFKKQIMKSVKRGFNKRGLAIPDNNLRQAYVLKGAKIIPNRFGTAPGQMLTVKGKTVILLPGPPHEMYPMFDNYVLPLLKKKLGLVKSDSIVLRIYGYSESRVNELIEPVVEKYGASKNVIFSILSSPGVGIEVNVFLFGGGVKKLKDKIKDELNAVLGKRVYTESHKSLERILGEILKRRHYKLSVAESCTGGLISKKLTDVPGSSKYFVQGFITYSNAGKIKLLKVKPEILNKHGAVSEECAREMVVGAQKAARSDCAIAVTGVAGPTGGTKNKPVGLVYIAVAVHGDIAGKEFKFRGARSLIRERASMSAMEFLRRSLLRII